MRRIFAISICLVACLCLLPKEMRAASENDITFQLRDDGSYLVSGCKGSASGDLVIPATYNGKPVTFVAAYAFRNCANLASITIPDGVTGIGAYAFAG